jgi:hypothetical protein
MAPLRAIFSAVLGIAASGCMLEIEAEPDPVAPIEPDPAGPADSASYRETAEVLLAPCDNGLSSPDCRVTHLFLHDLGTDSSVSFHAERVGSSFRIEKVRFTADDLGLYLERPTFKFLLAPGDTVPFHQFTYDGVINLFARQTTLIEMDMSGSAIADRMKLGADAVDRFR